MGKIAVLITDMFEDSEYARPAEAFKKMTGDLAKVKTFLGRAEEILGTAERSGMEVSTPKVELANARPRLIRARNSYRIAKNNLVNQLGLSVPKETFEDIPLILAGKLEAEPYKIELPRAIALALDARRRGLDVMLQEYIPGPPTCHYMVEGFVDRIGRPVARFVRQRLRMFPPDFGDSTYNRATQARRQPGSAFKPIIYAAAIERGFRPDSILLDSPISLPGGRHGQVWSPQYYDRRFNGPMRLATALDAATRGLRGPAVPSDRPLAPGSLVEQWRDELPNLAKLVDGGAWGELRSTDPPITVPAWTAMMTSKDPGTLGFYGFRNRKSYDYDELYFANAAYVKDDPAILDSSLAATPMGRHGDIYFFRERKYGLTRATKGLLLGLNGLNGIMLLMAAGVGIVWLASQKLTATMPL